MSTPELGRMTSQNRKEKPRDGLSRGAVILRKGNLVRLSRVRKNRFLISTF